MHRRIIWYLFWERHEGGWRQEPSPLCDSYNGNFLIRYYIVDITIIGRKEIYYASKNNNQDYCVFVWLRMNIRAEFFGPYWYRRYAVIYLIRPFEMRMPSFGENFFADEKNYRVLPEFFDYSKIFFRKLGHSFFLIKIEIVVQMEIIHVFYSAYGFGTMDILLNWVFWLVERQFAKPVFF